MKKIFPLLTTVLLSCIVLLVSCSTPASIPPINRTAAGVAIKGYDPVAYFTMGRPVAGQDALQYSWRGARWSFATREHLEMFQDNPERYAPQYGGYCAYAVSQGTTADIDPESWAIVDNKLYLNLNPDVQELWQRNREEYIRQANDNWPHLVKQGA
jgi:YHS domain-containing protein